MKHLNKLAIALVLGVMAFIIAGYYFDGKEKEYIPRNANTHNQDIHFGQ